MCKKHCALGFLIVIAVVVASLFAPTNKGNTAETPKAEKEKSLIDWGQNYIEGSGMAIAPKDAVGAQARALARRGAIMDLQRNILEFIGGAQIDAKTTMDDFMAEDSVRSEVHGLIKNIEIVKGEWNGENYTVTGRIKTEQLLVIVEMIRRMF